MKQRPLGSQGLQCSTQGLGCMGMSISYGPADEAESIATIQRSLELGVTLFDTAEVYGPFHNEQLLGRALGDRRDGVTIATKFGTELDDAGAKTRPVNGRPEYVRRAAERSLRHLGVDVIDLYYLHRPDPETPIEVTVGSMADLVTAGKIRFIGLSNAPADLIRRAHAVHPVTAVQSEYSIFTRDVETDGVLTTLRDLGIGLVAYSPVGRGLLTGAVRSLDGLADNDFRRLVPRFGAENLERNLALVDRLTQLASGRGVRPAQLALAWLHTRGGDVFPIPGTRRSSRLEENVAAADLQLTKHELAEVEAIVPAGAVAGAASADLGSIMKR